MAGKVGPCGRKHARLHRMRGLLRAQRYLCVEVQRDAVQHALGLRQGQGHAVVIGHASRRHHQALGRYSVRQGGAGRQAGD